MEGKRSDHVHVEDSREMSTLKLEGKAAVADDNAEEHQLTVRDILRNHKPLVWWSFFFGISAIGWGFDAQINGAVISIPAFRRDFGYIYQGEPVIPADWLSAFNIVSSVGQFFGGFICSTIIDRLGRKWGLGVGVVICCGGIFGEVFSTARAAFLISKLILGVGLGFYLTIGPLYCSEVSPVMLRGITTAGVNLGIVIGQLLSNAVIKGLGDRQDRWAYRGPFALQLIFVAFFAIGLPFAVESPWYLVRRQDIDGARVALQRLYGKDANVERKLLAIQMTVAQDLALKEIKWVDCFRGTNLQRTLITMGAFACQHLVGIIFVLGFSTYFFQLAGLAVSNSFDLGVGVTAVGVVGTVTSWFTVNKFGRRNIFIYGMCALTTLLLLMGILDVIHTNAAGWVQASLTVVWNFVYATSIGAMAFVLLGEVSSPALRAKTTALATATQSVFGIAMNFAVPYMVNPDAGNLKGKVGFIFGGLGLICTIVSFFYIPELKGRTFEEIDVMFHNRVPPRKMGTYDIEQHTE